MGESLSRVREVRARILERAGVSCSRNSGRAVAAELSSPAARSITRTARNQSAPRIARYSRVVTMTAAYFRGRGEILDSFRMAGRSRIATASPAAKGSNHTRRIFAPRRTSSRIAAI